MIIIIRSFSSNMGIVCFLTNWASLASKRVWIYPMLADCSCSTAKLPCLVANFQVHEQSRLWKNLQPLVRAKDADTPVGWIVWISWMSPSPAPLLEPCDTLFTDCDLGPWGRLRGPGPRPPRRSLRWCGRGGGPPAVTRAAGGMK